MGIHTAVHFSLIVFFTQNIRSYAVLTIAAAAAAMHAAERWCLSRSSSAAGTATTLARLAPLASGAPGTLVAPAAAVVFTCNA